MSDHDNQSEGRQASEQDGSWEQTKKLYRQRALRVQTNLALPENAAIKKRMDLVLSLKTSHADLFEMIDEAFTSECFIEPLFDRVRQEVTPLADANIVVEEIRQASISSYYCDAYRMLFFLEPDPLKKATQGFTGMSGKMLC